MDNFEYAARGGGTWSANRADARAQRTAYRQGVGESDVDELSLRVAAEVRAWMARRSVRQEGLAAKMGLSQSALSMRLRGRTRWTINDLAAVSEALDVPMAALWTPPPTGD